MEEKQDNKWWNQRLNKVFRKGQRYICCYPPNGNANKPYNGYACSYPQLYKRHNNKIDYKKIISQMDEDFTVTPAA